MKPASERAPRHNPNSHPAKLPSGYCKRRKGPHQFRYRRGDVYRVRVLGILGKDSYGYDLCFWEYRCTGCGKKKQSMEHINDTRKGT